MTRREYRTYQVQVRNDETDEEIAVRITAHTIADAKLHALWKTHEERGWEICTALADVGEVRP